MDIAGDEHIGVFDVIFRDIRSTYPGAGGPPRPPAKASLLCICINRGRRARRTRGGGNELFSVRGPPRRCTSGHVLISARNTLDEWARPLDWNQRARCNEGDGLP